MEAEEARHRMVPSLRPGEGPAKPDKDALDSATAVYRFAHDVVVFSSNSNFDRDEPTVQFQRSAGHASNVIELLSASDGWIKTGVLRKHDSIMMCLCTLLARHEAFHKHLIGGKGEDVQLNSSVGKLCSVRRKPDMFLQMLQTSY